MDKGEFIRGGYTVEPADGGSFIVFQGGRSYSAERLSSARGFTNYADLLRWLTEEHESLGRPLKLSPSEMSEVMRPQKIAPGVLA